jgi:hypothetical protein
MFLKERETNTKLNDFMDIDLQIEIKISMNLTCDIILRGEKRDLKKSIWKNKKNSRQLFL